MEYARSSGQLLRPRRRMTRAQQGFLFIVPWLIGLLVFKLYPFASSLYYSFTDYNLHKGISEHGFFNYLHVLTDRKNLQALRVTFTYAFLTVPLKLIFALFIAYILNYKLKGINWFRTIYYVPSILGGSVAIAVLWIALFKNDGIINVLLGYIGIDGPNWLASTKHAIWVVSILRIWQFGSAMVIFLAALKNVPEELYEAAAIDGAGSARQFLSVTVPIITPVIFYNLVTQLVQAFQEFNGPYIITRGGPRNSTTLMSLLIYNNGIMKSEMGLASAQAWILFIIILIFTVIAFLSQKHWVHYSD